MRLLIATSTFPLARNDGMPRFVYDLARALSRHCRVTVLAPHHPGALTAEEMGPVAVRRFRYAWPPQLQRLAYGSGMPDNLKQSPAAWALVPSYMGALATSVRKLVRQERIDVVNSHWLIPQSLGAAMALGRRRTCAHLATAHAGDVMMLEKLSVGRRICRYLSRSTEMFLPVGDHVAGRLRDLAGRAIDCQTQPMGVDYRRFSTPGRLDRTAMPFAGNFILFVGRLVPIKGVDVLLDAMPALFQADAGLGLVVIGSGPAEDRLRRKARQMGIDQRVNFTGRLDHHRIVPYLHACQALALPSIIGPGGETEGTPTVLAEALAAGSKVVATRTGGAAFILQDGRNGWLARPNDARDLCARLSVALAYQGDQIRRQAMQTAGQLDWERVADHYMSCFRNALLQRKAGQP